MAIAGFATVQEIINRAAVECGLTPVSDVFASSDPAFVQLRTLLTSCGQNLVESYDWEILRRQYDYTTIDCDKYLDHGSVTSGPFVDAETVTGGTSGATGVVAEVGDDYVALSDVTGTFRDGETITGGTSGASAQVTQIRDNGVYNLPDDFDRMIDQTHWERTNRYPMAGPLTPQQWQYLLGMQLSNQTIYATFRVMEGLFNILPQPPPSGLQLVYEYISRNWLRSATEPTEYYDVASANAQIVLFKPEMMVQFLRFKFLSAKGFATKGAADMFGKAYENATGADKGAPTLNAGGRRRYGPYGMFAVLLIHMLDWYNIPDTGYGIYGTESDPSYFILTEFGEPILLEESGYNRLVKEHE